MRWNCPHCNVALSVADDKLNTGWSYAKCYQCSEFAMVRKSAVTTEAQSKPKSGTAAEAAPAQVPIDAPIEKPSVRRATVRRANLPAKSGPLMKVGMMPPRFNHPQPTKLDSVTPNLQLSEAPVQLSPPLSAPVSTLTPELPKYFLQDSPPVSHENRAMRMAASLAAIVAIASGIYLYVEGQKIWEKAKLAGNHPTPIAQVARHLSRTVASTLGSTAVQVAQIDSMKDQISHRAMAPIRSESISSTSNPAMWISPRAENMSLRAGPGLEYPIVSTAQTKTPYRVLEWKDRWFRVQASNSIAADSKSLWIRNDLVNPVTSPQ